MTRPGYVLEEIAFFKIWHVGRSHLFKTGSKAVQKGGVYIDSWFLVYATHALVRIVSSILRVKSLSVTKTPRRLVISLSFR